MSRTARDEAMAVGAIASSHAADASGGATSAVGSAGRVVVRRAAGAACVDCAMASHPKRAVTQDSRAWAAARLVAERELG